jgi:hypothetical protein
MHIIAITFGSNLQVQDCTPTIMGNMSGGHVLYFFTWEVLADSVWSLKTRFTLIILSYFFLKQPCWLLIIVFILPVKSEKLSLWAFPTIIN